jgi:hypothetical protein
VGREATSTKLLHAPWLFQELVEQQNGTGFLRLFPFDIPPDWVVYPWFCENFPKIAFSFKGCILKSYTSHIRPIPFFAAGITKSN